MSDAQRAHVASLCDQLFVVPLGGAVRKTRAAVSLARGGSLTEGMFASARLQKQVIQWQESQPFDAVVVFCSSMYPYVDRPTFKSTSKIVDLVDVDSEKWQQMSRESAMGKRMIYALEAKRVRKLERRIADRATSIVLVSDSEAQLFSSSVASAPSVHGISNGVDTEYFRPSDQPPTPRGSQDTATPLRLVFTGVLDYSPNVEGIIWFCRQVLPALQRDLDVRLSIVGRRPNRRVLDLAGIVGVKVVGEVPDVRPYLHEADIAISPLKLARGIQNKVLEAMATALPVVTTTQSAEGIEAESGKQFIVADSVSEWCAAIISLANDSDSRQRIGEQARQLVVSQYSWPARLAKFEELLAHRIAEVSETSSGQTLNDSRDAFPV